MIAKVSSLWVATSVTCLGLAVLWPLAGCAQETLAAPGMLQEAPTGSVRLTLEEAKQQAVAKNKLLNLAAMNVEAKAYAIKAACADYFPKISANAMYFHFNDELGTVLATQGRTVSGPLGRP